MVQALLGKKIQQSQIFLENGKRIPTTMVLVDQNPVVAVKTNEKDGYTAVQIGFGSRKHTTKALAGHIRGAKLEKAPQFLREVRLQGDEDAPAVGDILKPADVFQPGDIVSVTGTSKGKGFAGVVKRHHFRGGPRTHGQSDRERAPGSIGQTTTPGRVYKGKRMAGHMGRAQATIRHLEVVALSDTTITLKGLLPGSVNSIVLIQKTGENKNFIPPYKTEEMKAQEAKAQEESSITEDQIGGGDHAE